MTENALFSVITLTFNRPHFLKELKDCLFAQTYQHFEWVIINNAATPETQTYLEVLKKSDTRVKSVDFATNQYDPKNSGKFIDICFNAALKICTGEFVFFISDDDLLSPNYLESMVKLFNDNPKCKTAAGLPVGFKQTLQPENLIARSSNFRSQYMSGHDLVLKISQGKNTLFGAPGNIFTLRRQDLLNDGGYHPAIELQEIYSIMPFGETGFDENAILYWRYHENQINKTQTSNGDIGLENYYDLMSSKTIQKRYILHFNEKFASEIMNNLVSQHMKMAAHWSLLFLFQLKFKPLKRILKNINYPFIYLQNIIYNLIRSPKTYFFQTYTAIKSQRNFQK